MAYHRSICAQFHDREALAIFAENHFAARGSEFPGDNRKAHYVGEEDGLPPTLVPSWTMYSSMKLLLLASIGDGRTATPSVGKIAIVETKATRAKTHTILGAICATGVVQLSIRKPSAKEPAAEKNRKVGTGGTKLVARGGTRTHHYLYF